MNKKRILEIYMAYTNKEMANIKYFINDSKDVCEEKLRVRDLYNEQDNNELFGTTLVNLLNKSNDILYIIHNYIISKEKISTILIYNFQNELEKKLGCKILKIILKQIIKAFMHDFDEMFDEVLNVQADKEVLLEKYLQSSELHYSHIQSLYVTLSEYVENNSNETVIITGRKIFILFLISLVQDIEFIINNCEKDIIEIPEIYKVDKYEIRTLKDLFYISKYHIQKSNKRIKRCRICGKYFVTKGNKTTEVYCRRKYKNKKYTCQELGTRSKRRVDNFTADLKADIKDELNRITSMLRKQDKNDNTSLNDEFLGIYKIKFSELESLEISEDEILQMKLEWLKEQHKNYKKKNRHKI